MRYSIRFDFAPLADFNETSFTFRIIVETDAKIGVGRFAYHLVNRLETYSAELSNGESDPATDTFGIVSVSVSNGTSKTENKLHPDATAVLPRDIHDAITHLSGIAHLAFHDIYETYHKQY